ncbi:zinc finger protein 845 isoform X10 [Agrilus planipennis]|uniref:Zinc finger protein 845 isoform X10 n=1 Tax=Agrilus planipennis TaxID=224129 RepID=A0A1W4XH51_AGRPL|nr:zinc finger protein 845 isoform X10 [Agrilus planipennis]
MVNSVELMQLCRLCLVKDEVNIPIFDNETDVQQIFLKISTCLPVKVTQDDNLPKKICNDCSYKLDLCYQFWNTSANSEKQLVTWLNEVGLSQETLNEAKLQKTESNSTPGLVLKQETIEPESESSHEVVNNVSTESQEYILQQQQLPYQTPAFPFTDDNFVSGESANAGASKTHTNNKRESTLKRKRQAVATVTQPDSDDDVDEDIDDPTETKVAKTEETSDDDRDDDGLNDEESTEFAGVPSTSTDNEQPGPSGIGKNVVDAPSHPSVEECVFVEDYKVKVETEDSDSANGFKCYECHIAFADKRNMFCHIKQQHEPNLRVCNICVTAFRNEQERDVHNSLMHKTKDNKYKKTQYNCPECHLTFSYKRVMLCHFKRTHQPALVVCKRCNTVFPTEDELHVHYKVAHIRGNYQKRDFKCTQCSRRCASEMRLKQHILLRHSNVGDMIKCEECNVMLKVTSYGEHITNQHVKRSTFTCDNCNKVFRSESYFRIHMNTHNPNYAAPVLQCRECPFECSSNKSLNKHKATHNKSNLLMCEYCGKYLASSNSLRTHITVVHAGEKPHPCGYCGKAFGSQKTLKVHLLQHTKEKPHMCNYCEKRFTQRNSLVTHIRSAHTGEKPFKCQFCDKDFVTKSALNLHAKRHEKIG